MAAKSRASRVVQLRPQNPFDLIRLLARSQSDPRKAVAELVQNSLDAGATRIEIQWFNDKGNRALSIWDNGIGVFPDMERDEALRRIAQTIGHSHKRDLTPVQRREEMILGKYGIGLIGFWSVGRTLEMRSRVHGGRAHVLRLIEDRAKGEVFASRSRLLDEPETFTEVVVREVHDAAVNKLRPPRLQAYLAQELRGQLLERGAAVTILDRVARGRARKSFLVQPRPYLGRPVEDLTSITVPGFEDARVELYQLLPDEDRPALVSLSCGGTVVLDDIGEIDGPDQPRDLWRQGRFEGVIDFPDLHVSPASRRGFAHNEPVAAFLVSLDELEGVLCERIRDEVERRAARKKESLAREIRKAFSQVAAALPEYDFFDVKARHPSPKARAASPDMDCQEAGGEEAAGGEAEGGALLGSNPVAPVSPDVHDELRPPKSSPPGFAGSPAEARGSDTHGSDTHGFETKGELEDAGDRSGDQVSEMLFPPGPLASVEISPKRLQIKAHATRGLRARALDADGRACSGAEVSFDWSLEGPGELIGDCGNARYTACDVMETKLRARIMVLATQGDVTAVATANVILEAPDLSVRMQGIPEPHAIGAPAESWRSRVVDGRWEFNEAHRDFLAVADVEAKRLRYLINLFAKEIVLRNFGGPGHGEVLERMVEVLTQLDRR